VDGVLKTLNFSSVSALNIDPVEKKPLFHFLPGTKSLSTAAPGCNFQCPFCQNWKISQSPRTHEIVSGKAVTPEQIVTAAKNYDCQSISYTYTEPTVFFELAYETSRIAHMYGLRNCFVSNGYMTTLAIETIAPYLDAINVDLKAFNEKTYRDVMKADMDQVLRCLRDIVQAGIWLEVTTLIVPGMNDLTEELEDLADFIASDLSLSVPWHITRFHGNYKWSEHETTPHRNARKSGRDRQGSRAEVRLLRQRHR